MAAFNRNPRPQSSESASFYDLARLELELESILGCKVDVLTPAGLAPDIADRTISDLRQFL
jgi:predicted nucleotidyltransferase